MDNMAHNYKVKGSHARLRHLLMLLLISGLLSVSTRAFSQTPPPGPPPPPPPPGEMFKKINPFKKHKDTVNKKDTAKVKPAVVPAGGPPPPPNPLNLFKKKKKDTTTKPAPPAGH